MPGNYVSADQTDMLMWGYWPSYNRPYYTGIYDGTNLVTKSFDVLGLGYAAVAAEYGDMFSYQLCPRAEIFRRDAGNLSYLLAMTLCRQSSQ